jgi:transposase-like protein
LILALSAEQVAGPRTPGKASGEIRHHGSQLGRIQLADRKVRLKRPRLRHKTEGEVKIPAYEALRQNQALGPYMPGALMRGISAREYHEVLPKRTETVGVSRSAVSRQAMEASIEQLKQLQERRWNEVEMLVIYIDGQRFGEHHILSAVGVDIEARKHIMGMAAGATENAAAVKELLTDCAIAACPRSASICSSSTEPRSYTTRPSRRSSAMTRRCSGVAITSWRTS